MNTLPFLGGVALLCGALIAIQAQTNAVLLRSVEDVFWVAAALFAVGFIYLASLIIINRTPAPNITQFLSAPFWSFSGGIIVATYVITITFLVPKIGVGNAIIFVVSGQIIMAVLIDHWGLFNVPVKAIDYKRLSGIVLLLSGIYLAKA